MRYLDLNLEFDLSFSVELYVIYDIIYMLIMILSGSSYPALNTNSGISLETIFK